MVPERGTKNLFFKAYYEKNGAFLGHDVANMYQ